MKKGNKHIILYSVLRLALFAVVFAVSFLALEKLFYSDAKKHPVWKYVVSEEHAPIDILFLGNSHVYSSIDGKMLSEATGLNIRSLTCASANGVNVAADLEAFLQYEVPKVVVAELCPFGADQVNFEEMRKEKLGILFDHFDGIRDFNVHLKAVSHVVSNEDIPAGVFQLFRSAMIWDRWSRDKADSKTYDEYGAHSLFAVEYDTRLYPDMFIKAYSTPSEGNTGLVPQNVEAFLSVVDLAERYGFELWIYNAPTHFYNQNYADLLRLAASLQEEHSCIRYIDNSMLFLTEIGIDKTDYYDAYHLNLNGMEKVSEWMGEKIAKRFHTGFNSDSLLHYKSCVVTMLENGKYRYEYEMFCPGRHRFTYTKDGEEHDTGLTDRNWFEEGALSEEEIKTLYVISRTAEKGSSGSVKHRFLPFMIEKYSAKIQGGGILLRNESNFRDDLAFAWQVTNKVTNEMEEYEYRNNEVFLPFTENGIYEIRAITRQQSDSVSRESDIMIVTYDAISKNLAIDQAEECVTVE